MLERIERLEKRVDAIAQDGSMAGEPATQEAKAPPNRAQ
jgi:hypothetical protein